MTFNGNVKRVVIIGGAYYGNRGATLMLKLSIRKIHEILGGNVKFDVWVEQIDANQPLCDDSNVTLIEFSPLKFSLIVLPVLFFNFILGKKKALFPSDKLLQSCCAADLFFDISGISFLDDRTPIFLLYDTFVSLPGIWLNTPIVKAAQAFGPFENPLNRILAKLILPRITKIYARGSESLVSLKKLGLTNVALAADLGFTFPDPVIRKVHDSFVHFKKPIIGISVSSVVFQKCQKMKIDYLGILDTLILYILEKEGGTIVLIPHAIKDDENIKNNDVPIIKKVLARTESRQVQFFPEVTHPYEIRQLISQCDFLIASRFHAMVSSLAVGVPGLILGWSHKYREVLEMFDLTNCSITYQNMEKENVIGIFQEYFSKKEILIDKIALRIHKVRKLANVNFEEISKLVNPSNPREG